MPITTTPVTRLGPWGVSIERYGSFTGKAADLGAAYEVVRWRGTSEPTVAWLGLSEPVVRWRGEVDPTASLVGDV